MKNGFVFIKLMVFFLIIAGISFGLYYFLKMPMLFYTCDGCIIIAAIFFIAWLFRLFFKKDIDRSLSSVDTTKWNCNYCGTENPTEARFCTNCGKEHLQEGNINDK